MRFNHKKLATAIALTTVSQWTVAQVLEEVFVTAQKRTESLQNVPISIEVISGARIDAAGIQNMSALSTRVPNLIISEGVAHTIINIRGIGSGVNGAFEQSVGMFIDGVYMGRGRQYRSPFLDVGSVEVLRGPQGTLLGKNTIAGAINVTTASPVPGDDLNGNLSLSVEENNGLIAEGVISGSLTDDFALRLAGKHRESDGYIDNVYLDQDEPEIEEDLLRLSAVWQPADNIDLTFKYSHSEYNRKGQPTYMSTYLSPDERAANFPNESAFASIVYGTNDFYYPEMGVVTGEQFKAYRDNNLGTDRSSVGLPVFKEDENNDKVDNVSVKADIRASGHTFTSISGYSSYDYKDSADIDYLPLRMLMAYVGEDFDQYSQEFRVASDTDGKIEYMLGAYYEKQKSEQFNNLGLDATFDNQLEGYLGVPSLMTLLSGGAYNEEFIASHSNYDLDTETWALFAQGTYSFSDNVHLTLGIRYTDESKDADSSVYVSDSESGVGNASEAPYLNYIWASAFNVWNREYDVSRSEDHWIPSANIRWEPTALDMFYASASKGYKSGGFNANDAQAPRDADALCFLIGCSFDNTIPADDHEFDDEEVTSFEIGGKHMLFDMAFSANWALFYSEFDDQQVAVFNGISFSVDNAAKSTVKGLEADFLWQATEELRLGLSLAYLNAEYDDYSTAPCTVAAIDAINNAPCTADLAGESLPQAPEYSGSFHFDYDRALSSGMVLFAGGELSYSDDYFTDGDNDRGSIQDSYSLINLRLGLRSSSGNWEGMVYGRNITDEEISNFIFDAPLLSGSYAGVYSEGEVWGARLRYNF